jgi:hypothetical protein
MAKEDLWHEVFEDIEGETMIMTYLLSQKWRLTNMNDEKDSHEIWMIWIMESYIVIERICENILILWLYMKKCIWKQIGVFEHIG